MYITPRVLIQQEFLQLPVYREFPLPAFIIGPNYALTRYSEAAEKPFTALATLDGVYLPEGNAYQADTDVRYDFPNVPAGGSVDADYTKVFAEAVEAQYFPNTDLGSDSSTTVSLVPGPAGQVHSNKIRFDAAILKSTTGYTRSSFLGTRDVTTNDIVEVTDANGLTARGKIQALIADTALEDLDLAAKIGDDLKIVNGTNGAVTSPNLTTFVSSGANFTDAVVGTYLTINSIGVRKILARVNSTTLKLDASVAAGTGYVYHVHGAYNAVGNTAPQSMLIGSPTHVTGTGTNPAGTLIKTSGSVYVGYAADEVLSDTYTVTVTAGATAGHPEDAEFSVSALSGVPAIRTGAVVDGDGLLVVDDANNNDVQLDFSGVTGALVVGTAWTVAATAAVVQVNPTSAVSLSSTYSGPSDMVYKLTVARGGAFYDGSNDTTCARLVISASDIDTSAAVLPRANTDFAVGSFGVKAKFASGSNNGGLIAGDAYFIPVSAEKVGPVRVVEFAGDISELSLATPDNTFTAKLFLVQNSVQVPQVRDLSSTDTNWDQEANYLTVNAGLTTYDPALVALGEPVRLPVASAKLFAEHRDLLQDAVNSIASVRDLASVATTLGVVHPDNPLAQGVYDAVLNANNQIVYYIAVETDDLAGYAKAIQISEKSDKVYSFVPLTFNRPIQDAVVAHVNAYSTPEVGRWRIAWLSVEDKLEADLYNLKTDGTPFQATITDDPAVTGTQYKYVTVAGAAFITGDNKLRPNDKLRLNFRLNADGKLVFDEYVVDQVRTDTTFTVTRPLAAAIPNPVKAVIVRSYTKDERATNIALVGGEYNNRRVRVVFPDSFKYGGVTKQGYFAAAGLAGLRSGVVPHQGLTNTEYLGADDLTKIVVTFTQDQLNTMAEQGIWLITQEVVGATPYVRHQLTTDERSLNTSEDSITTNVDSISYALKATLSPYIGRYNINPENIAVVRAAVCGELAFRATSTWTARAGNQLVSFIPKDDIIRLEQNTTYKDRIDCEVRLNVPYPMNYINLKLIVG